VVLAPAARPGAGQGGERVSAKDIVRGGSSHGIAFTAKNVAEDPAARDELIAKTGRMAVPVITVDGEVIVGFDRGRLKRLLGI
jgi:glutaredoxin